MKTQKFCFVFPIMIDSSTHLKIQCCYGIKMSIVDTKNWNFLHWYRSLMVLNIVAVADIIIYLSWPLFRAKIKRLGPATTRLQVQVLRVASSFLSTEW